MSPDWEAVRIRAERDALILEYGQAQQRMSRMLAERDAQIMQLRAALMVRETALAWAHEDRDSMLQELPGLSRRVALVRRVRELEERVQSLLRAQRRVLPAGVPQFGISGAAEQGKKVVLWIGRTDDMATGAIDKAARAIDARLVTAGDTGTAEFDEGLAEADLVICQTGCVSHRAWWRVKDYCQRTGKRCVLVDRPDALRTLFPSTGTDVADSSSLVG